MDNNKNKKLIRKVIIICGSLIGSCFLFLLMGYTYISDVVGKETIYDGIYINDIHLGGLTKEEAMEQLSQYVQSKKDFELVVYYQGESQVVRLSEVGYDASFEELVEEAYNIGKEGNIVKRYKVIKDLEQEAIYLSLPFTYDENKVLAFLETVKNTFSKNPKNAIIQRIDNKFEIESEVLGYEVDYEATKRLVLEAIAQASEDIRIEAIMQTTAPEYTAEYYGKIQNQIGSFYTLFNTANELRTENLRVGASKIDGTVLHPGETFSTYSQLAPINAANGYKPAPVIVNGMIEDGMGGGICQVATTLYNALLLSELEILERRNHSMPVSYIEKGRDAALFANILDLKFKNSTPYPIFIESYILGDRLYMNIYGYEERDPNRRLEFESVIIETISPPPAKITYDSQMENGKSQVLQKEIPGYKVKLYKNVYIGDQLIEHTLVNYSEYRPTAAVIKVGTKGVSPTINTEIKQEVIPQEETIIEGDLAPVPTPNTDNVEEVFDIESSLIQGDNHDSTEEE